MRNAIPLAVLVGVLGIPFSNAVHAATLNVDGNDGGCNDVVGTPYCTIQAAIDDAVPGMHQVSVAPGTYNEIIDLLGKAITVRSSGGPSVTTIDATGVADPGDGLPVVRCDSGEGPDTVLDGFTITGGTGQTILGSESQGGGMYNNGSSPTVMNCVFSGNSAFLRGGGMFNSGGSPTVTNCTFSGNSVVQNGGGMFNSGSSPTVTNCTFTGNTANFSGGGMFNFGGSPTLINCTFAGNTTIGSGGGMVNSSSSPTVTNCTFGGNTATNDGGGMANSSSCPTVTNCTFGGNTATNDGGGMYNVLTSDPIVTNSIFWMNSDAGGTDESAQIHNDDSPEVNTPVVNTSDLQGGWTGAGGTGNLDADPLFVDAPGGDLHLQAGSPCIDAGDNNVVTELTDLDGDTRVVGCAVDMGAYEQQTISDADDDGVPDACDICPDFDDAVDTDGDGIPDGCDDCPGFDDAVDSDGDGVADGCDACAGSDDTLDADGDGVADGCDQCANFDDGNLPAPGTQPILFVDAGALGANDGTSWDDAFTDLQAALCAATISGGVVTEVWVAAGTYTPTGFAGNPERTFQLLNGVSIYGGFAGGEALLSLRDPQANETFLSGDLNGDDAPVTDPVDLSGEPTRADNSNHVVTGSGTDATAILDGFTITAGGHSSIDGGGMSNVDGDPTIVGCLFFQNQAASGGGMYNENSNPMVTDCTFNANSAPLCGGGMFNIEGSSPTVVNCAFGGNMSGSGGGMSSDFSSPTVINCAFSGNTAFGGGGMYNHSSSPTVINSTFSGNAATFTGGGIYACGDNLTVTNSIFWDNVEDSDGNAGGPFTNESAQIDAACGPATVNHSNVQGGWTGAGGTGNINVDPQFVDADGADNTVGTDDDDLRLQAGSPCIDAADDGAVTEPADLDGNTRVIGCSVDMGAYEQQTISDTDGDGVPDGCDVCLGFDDTVDSDGDGVPDGCDVCLGDDATGDSDGDDVCDDIDTCPGFDDTLDADGDGVPDGCDVCLGNDATGDSDGDGVCDDIDACPGFDDTVDSDGDGVPDGCDVCLGDDATGDGDGDGVCDDIDACAGFDDTLDADGDDVPDGCDVCPGQDDTLDTDGDGVPEGCDVCPGFDDTTDSDSDGVPDGCDVCPGFDDNLDANANGVPDDCELPCDIDLDGDVDGTDNAIFVSCMTGPVNTTPLDALCAIADLDLDDDIDMLDYAECHTAFTGPSASDLPNTTVSGFVRMPDGSPVFGADVEMAGGGPSVVSKSDGRFLIPSVPAALGEISVIASVSIEGEDFLGSARVAELVGGGMTDVGIITLHNVVNWVSPADGPWSDGVNWDTGLPPGADLSVVIDVPDPEITVTHDAGAPNDGPLANLLCNERLRLEFDSLSVAGVFQMNNTLEMEFGELVDSTVDLGPGAVINILRGSTLDGVTINGNMDILGTNNILEVLNGLTINGDVRIAGVGFQVATGSGLGFHGPNKILDGRATYTFISNPSTSFIAQGDAGSLHIKPGVTIRGAEGRVGHSDHPLVQDGVIDSDLTGTIEIKGLDWVNNGALRSRGDGSVLWVGNAWTNHGSIEAENSGQLVLGDPGHSFQNLGTIIATDADVRLNGDFMIADLGTFDFINSLVAIEGTLLNGAGLVLEAGRFNWKLGRGTILGGTISSADGTTFDLVAGLCCSSNATFDGVTLDADMQMSTNDFLLIENGLTLNGVITMPGFIAGRVTLHFKGPNRFIDGTGRIEFSRPGQNNIFQSGTGGAGDLGVLTIGPGITIGGAAGVIGDSGNVFPASLVNEGTVHSDQSGFVVVQGTGSINNGILESSDGGLQITGTWTNNGTVHVGGGSFRADKTWTNNGIARFGVGPLLESRADYTQTSAGTFISEIRSTLDGEFGRMTVTGTATLDGVLRIEFENTFTPVVGQSFAVLEYGDRMGEFATIETVGLDPGFQIVPTYHESFLGLVIQKK